MFILQCTIRVALYLRIIKEYRVFGACLVRREHLVVDFFASVKVRRLVVLPRYDCTPTFVLYSSGASYEVYVLSDAFVKPELCKHNVVSAKVVEPVKDIIRSEDSKRTVLQRRKVPFNCVFG